MNINHEAVHKAFPGATIKADGTAAKADGSEITAQEIENAVATYANAAQAKQNIDALEAQVTNRRLREAALTDEGKAWLQNIEDQIAIERAKL